MFKNKMNTVLFYLNLVLYFRGTLCSSGDGQPEVETRLGRVRGFWNTSLDGRKYAGFLGLPYAKPPVNDLRFEEPEPIVPWAGTWEGNVPHACLQTNIFGNKIQDGEEDCLYLNIFVPAEFLRNSKKLDVVVYIHPGGFTTGSGHSMSNPSVLMDRDIIFVSINYRLGFFGFLSTDDGAIPGNNGLKDQVLALKWVRDNIASFGGNPDSVTIAGLSSGGISVHFHYISPLSKGLFHKGLSHSGGSVLSPWGFKKYPLQNTKRLAEIGGCSNISTEETKNCLKQRPANSLMKIYYEYEGKPFAPFAPVVEKGSKKPFLDKEPYLKLKEGDINDVPWITSTAKDEGLLPTAFFWSDLDKINEQWAEIALYFLDYNDTLLESRKETVAREILDFYLGPGQKINKNNFKNLTQMFTDGLYALPTEAAARMQSKITKSPVYYFLFDYKESQNKLVERFTGGKLKEGVAHGEDCTYFYGLFFEKPFSEKDKRLRNACQNMLYSFASTGKPSFDGSDDWKATDSDKLTFLNIMGPENMRMQTVEHLTPSGFWSKIGLLDKENRTVKDEL